MAWIGASKAPVGCVFCNARESRDDRTTYLLERSDHAFLILNAYPYASGHLMAVVNRHVGTLVGAVIGVASAIPAKPKMVPKISCITMISAGAMSTAHESMPMPCRRPVRATSRRSRTWKSSGCPSPMR